MGLIFYLFTIIPIYFTFNYYFKKKKVNKTKKFLLILFVYVILAIIILIFCGLTYYGESKVNVLDVIIFVIFVMILTIPTYLITCDLEPIDKNKMQIDAEDKGEMILKGCNGIIRIKKDKVIISRENAKSFFDGGGHNLGEKVIPIKNIVGVDIGKPLLTTEDLSYIRFVIAGSVTVRIYLDPNTVIINDIQQYQMAIKIKDYIEKLINNNDNIVNQVSLGADEILKYKKLLDEGILTQEEFDAKKKQLLGL